MTNQEVNPFIWASLIPVSEELEVTKVTVSLPSLDMYVTQTMQRTNNFNITVYVWVGAQLKINRYFSANILYSVAHLDEGLSVKRDALAPVI